MNKSVIVYFLITFGGFIGTLLLGHVIWNLLLSIPPIRRWADKKIEEFERSDEHVE